MFTGLEFPANDCRENTLYLFSRFETSSFGMKDVEITKNQPIAIEIIIRADLSFFFQLI